MMNDQDSNLAMNAICHAASMAGNRLQEAISCYDEPSVLYRPALTRDGNQWCALYGIDLQSGVAGFGDSPYQAMCAFNKAWYEKLEIK